MKKIIICLSILANLAFSCGFPPEVREPIKNFTTETKDLLEKKAITITECDKNENCKQGISSLSELDMNKTHYVHVEKQVYCFNFEYKKETRFSDPIITLLEDEADVLPFYKLENDETNFKKYKDGKTYRTYYDHPELKTTKDGEKYYLRWNRLVVDRFYCFSSKEELEKGKIEKMAEIKAIVDNEIYNKHREELKSLSIFGMFLLIVAAIVFCLYHILDYIRNREIYIKIKNSKFIEIIGKCIYYIGVFIYYSFLIGFSCFICFVVFKLLIME